ncbi:MAG: hypothetical protein J6Y92_10255 [Lentisphaeria bacterium]|nr:hypothetical protein [Lentisphaeria bacterium]
MAINGSFPVFRVLLSFRLLKSGYGPVGRESPASIDLSAAGCPDSRNIGGFSRPGREQRF